MTPHDPERECKCAILDIARPALVYASHRSLSLCFCLLPFYFCLLPCPPRLANRTKKRRPLRLNHPHHSTRTTRPAQLTLPPIHSMILLIPPLAVKRRPVRPVPQRR